MRKRFAGTVAATAALTAILAAPGPAGAAVRPKVGSYGGAVRGTTIDKRLAVEVVRRGRGLRVRMLDFGDACASQLFLLDRPLALGDARKPFHRDVQGHTNTIGYRIVFDGRFTGRRKATVTVQSFEGDLIPPPGVQPGTANICSDTTVFHLKFLPDGL